MNMQGNPTRKNDRRNIYCSHYDNCLDYVVERNWRYWSCERCKHLVNQDARPEVPIYINHSIPYYEIHID